MGRPDLFVSDVHSLSLRRAIISAERDSIWLYLTPPNEPSPELDCWLFNLPDAPAEPEFSSYRAHASPPPVPHSLTLTGSNIPLPQPSQLSFRWSPEGHAVAALLDQVPVGLIIAGTPRGFARYLTGAGPWGAPWDDARYRDVITPLAS